METMIAERYELCRERISEIAQNAEVGEELKAYFTCAAKLAGQILNAYELVGQGFFAGAPIAELRRANRALYEELFSQNYERCYGNPAYACKMLGADRGKMLSFLYAELRCMIPCAFERRLTDLVIRMELFVEVYNMFSYAMQEGEPAPSDEALRDTMYWFVSDYSETTAQWRVATQVAPAHDFAVRIVMDSDLNDVRYLYKYGEFVTPETEALAQYLASLSDERIQLIADTYTQGYRIGFEKAGKPLEKKETVDIIYVLGFERIVRTAIGNFAKMGLKPVIYRASDSIFHRKGMGKSGYCGADANKQYRFDHKDDIGLFLDKKLVNRKLEVLQLAYEQVKDQARGYAGPAVIEVFGEKPFAPQTKQEACALRPEQQKLSAEYRGASAEIVNRYIIGEERSFTVIAFPLPDIGERFEEIFDETVKLNTLDYKTYERVQALMIDALNTAEYVRIKGMNGNRTDLRVALYPVKNPDKEAVFENCVADVNIPVGEIFTSPVLAGTNGTLHVSHVFLNELEYRNLELVFDKGMISDYTCTNFECEEENKKYVKENVLFNYDTLPMGEFAIGTNTTAYMTAKKYDISHLFPILIAEKTGPHFAVGDTCYSREEDVKLYNEDGKEIVAKDNEVSLLRHSDPSKAYFACHTDITIPYDELGEITACYADKTECTIIKNGRFVLAGTQELNKAFDET